MSTFTTPLIFQEIAEQRWRIEEPFIYYVGNLLTGIPVFVPEGFINRWGVGAETIMVDISADRGEVFEGCGRP